MSNDKLREALEKIKYEATSLSDAQVIALEAISASNPEPNEADDLLRRLGLDPEQYRTDGGYINHMKVKAAIRHPEDYPRIDQCQHEFVPNADFGGSVCKLCGKPERVWSKPERIASNPDPQAQAGEPGIWGVWLDGEPPHPWRDEWFIAETIYGDRVVLRHMGEGLSHEYKTADETYMRAKNVKRWMQFPDGEYISAATSAIAKKDAALQACVKIIKRYRNETPLGHQPHMIAHVADAAITQAEGALK